MEIQWKKCFLTFSVYVALVFLLAVAMTIFRVDIVKPFDPLRPALILTLYYVLPFVFAVAFAWRFRPFWKHFFALLGLISLFFGIWITSSQYLRTVYSKKTENILSQFNTGVVKLKSINFSQRGEFLDYQGNADLVSMPKGEYTLKVIDPSGTFRFSLDNTTGQTNNADLVAMPKGQPSYGVVDPSGTIHFIPDDTRGRTNEEIQSLEDRHNNKLVKPTEQDINYSFIGTRKLEYKNGFEKPSETLTVKIQGLVGFAIVADPIGKSIYYLYAWSCPKRLFMYYRPTYQDQLDHYLNLFYILDLNKKAVDLADVDINPW